VFSPWRLLFEKRALEAWAEQKLILVKLDHHFAPIGLRDLPFIDASFEAQRDFAWGKVAAAVAAQPKTPTPPPPGGAPVRDEDSVVVGATRAPPAPHAKQTPPRKARGGGAAFWIFGWIAVLLGLAAGAVAGAIWLVTASARRRGRSMT